MTDDRRSARALAQKNYRRRQHIHLRELEQKAAQVGALEAENHRLLSEVQHLRLMIGIQKQNSSAGSWQPAQGLLQRRCNPGSVFQKQILVAQERHDSHTSVKRFCNGWGG